MTKPEKQDGTMELDVGQIDLLDLPLPPRSGAALDENEPRVSKGPPPLPPSMPPAEPLGSAAVDAPSASEDAARRAFAAEAAFNPPFASPHAGGPIPPDAARASVSARKLVAETQPQGSAAMRFLVGVGGASLLCVALFFGYRAFHKTAQVPAKASASASATPAPTQAFTMAPIEFTDDSANVAPSSAPSASTSPSAAPTTTSTRPHAQTTTTSAPSHASSTPPRRTDEVIKVEN